MDIYDHYKNKKRNSHLFLVLITLYNVDIHKTIDNYLLALLLVFFHHIADKLLLLLSS